jgi:hypothetical protein
MKVATYTDANGFKRAVLIKDTDDERHAERGIPAGPPDLEDIDWFALRREVNNIFAEQGVLDWLSYQQKPEAASAALSVFKRHIVDLFRRSAQANAKRA